MKNLFLILAIGFLALTIISHYNNDGDEKFYYLILMYINLSTTFILSKIEDAHKS